MSTPTYVPLTQDRILDRPAEQPVEEPDLTSGPEAAEALAPTWPTLTLSDGSTVEIRYRLREMVNLEKRFNSVTVPIRTLNRAMSALDIDADEPAEDGPGLLVTLVDMLYIGAGASQYADGTLIAHGGAESKPIFMDRIGDLSIIEMLTVVMEAYLRAFGQWDDSGKAGQAMERLIALSASHGDTGTTSHSDNSDSPSQNSGI